MSSDTVVNRLEEAHRSLVEVCDWARISRADLDPVMAYRLLVGVRGLLSEDLYPLMETLTDAVLEYRDDPQVWIEGREIEGGDAVDTVMRTAYSNVQSVTTSLYDAGAWADRAAQAMTTVYREGQR